MKYASVQYFVQSFFLIFNIFLDSFTPFLNENSWWQFLIIDLCGLLGAYVCIPMLTVMGIFFVNSCLYIEFFTDLYRRKFEVLNRQVLRMNVKEIIIKNHLVDIIKLQIRIIE